MTHAPRRGTDQIIVTRGPAGTVYRCRVCGFHESGRDPQAKTTAFAVLRRHVSDNHRETYQAGRFRVPGATTEHNRTE